MPISYSEALQIIQTTIQPLSATHNTPLLKGIHSICATDIKAPFALPRYSMSLKEGYGVAFSPHTSVYKLLQPPYSLPIPEGYGVYLSTGERIPMGIDTIIAEEDVHLENNHTLTLPLHVNQSQHVKKEGEDIEQGELLVKKNERISAQKITALAALGIKEIEIQSKPKVALLSIGTQLATGEIHNSNAMTLAARVIELGGEILEMMICKEDETTILEHLQKMSLDADCIMTTGALSRHDAMRSLLEKKHLLPLFHHVRIAPAKPSALSLLNNIPILHLPGLPLGCMLGFEILGVPLLRRLQNQPGIMPKFITCINQKIITCKDHCMNAIPGYSNGKQFVSAPYYEAGRLNILSQCNGYVLCENQEVIEEGEEVPFFYFTYPPVS